MLQYQPGSARGVLFIFIIIICIFYLSLIPQFTFIHRSVLVFFHLSSFYSILPSFVSSVSICWVLNSKFKMLISTYNIYLCVLRLLKCHSLIMTQIHHLAPCLASKRRATVVIWKPLSSQSLMERVNGPPKLPLQVGWVTLRAPLLLNVLRVIYRGVFILVYKYNLDAYTFPKMQCLRVWVMSSFNFNSKKFFNLSS